MDFLSPLAVLMLIVWFIGTFWVLTDATVNSEQSAILWGLVAFFGAILGILLYVLLGRNTSNEDPSEKQTTERHRGTPSHVCDSCGEEYYLDSPVDINTCRGCGGVKVSRT